MNLTHGPVAEATTLLRRKFSAQSVVHESQLADLGIERVVNFLYDDLVARLNVSIPSRDGHTLEVPADWWAALKLRWFPRWWLKRRPARMTTYLARAYYPELPIPDPRISWERLPPEES